MCERRASELREEMYADERADELRTQVACDLTWHALFWLDMT